MLMRTLIRFINQFTFDEFDDPEDYFSTMISTNADNAIPYPVLKYGFRIMPDVKENTYAIVNQDDFKGIVSMGYDAVPFILEVIDSKPSTLVWALNVIFNHKISDNPQTTVSKACKLWIKALKN